MLKLLTFGTLLWIGANVGEPRWFSGEDDDQKLFFACNDDDGWTVWSSGDLIGTFGTGYDRADIERQYNISRLSPDSEIEEPCADGPG